jgi:hypothetical protein
VLSPVEQRSRYFSLTPGLVNSWAALPPPCGRGDRQEGVSPRVHRSGVRRHSDEGAVLTTTEALNRRKISSVDVFSPRYLWPRGPLRTSEAAPGRINFLQALELRGKIYDLGMVIHPGDEPSGVVPGIVAGDRAPRSSYRRGGEEGPNCFFSLSF